MRATHMLDAVPSRPRKDGLGSLPFRLGLLAVAICWLLVFFPALSSAAKIWWISEYYTHGLVVLPAIIYACWIRREELLGETWPPAYGVAPLLVATLLLYLLGSIGRVSLFQHVAAFASLPLIAWLCLGNALFLRSYNIMLLPLLAIPIGAELGPLLQQLTAYMSAVLLSLTDITFIRRGCAQRYFPGRRGVFWCALSDFFYRVCCVLCGAILSLALAEAGLPPVRLRRASCRQCISRDRDNYDW